uniref:Uncharacterized protein n=1 Tax=Phytophthora ramorum TaxID=164328 RepID=H3GKE8_PHYRM
MAQLSETPNAQQQEFSALVASAHVQYVQSCRRVFLAACFPLSDGEIRALEGNGNSGPPTNVEEWFPTRDVEHPAAVVSGAPIGFHQVLSPDGRYHQQGCLH